MDENPSASVGVDFLSDSGPENVEVDPRRGVRRRLRALKLSIGSRRGEWVRSIPVGEDGGEKRKLCTGEAILSRLSSVVGCWESR